MIEGALVAKSALASLGMMALQGTILALLAVALVRGRMRPAWQAAVWLVVLVKFVLPWGPAMPWSLADLIAILRGDAAEGAAIVLPAATGIAPEIASPTASIAWLALAAVWLAGAIVVLARAVAGHRRTRRAIEASRPAPPLARELLADLGARRVRLLVGPAITGPFVVGLFRPTIVVPPALLADRALLRAALLHELAHVRRLDAVGRALQLVARALFWWCPVVHLVNRRLDRARESACDAHALEAGQISRPAYARLLLQMAQLNACSHASSLAAPHALDGRITSVLGPPMRSRLSAVHAVALVAWIALALGGARSADARGAETCVYSLEFAEALRQAHPEADLDRDGVLSHDEACDFQAELRRSMPAAPGPQASALLAEPLCCNCDASVADPAVEPTCSRAAE
jgi:beta-lactamase regulating signal transducer with metallopeptidase domain